MKEWRKIKGYHYSVSSDGDVRNDWTEKCLKHQKSKRGGFYPFVNLYRNGKRKNRTVHGLVAEAFLGVRPEGYQVHHKDTDISNPAASNLEYVTAKRNLELRR